MYTHARTTLVCFLALLILGHTSLAHAQVKGDPRLAQRGVVSAGDKAEPGLKQCVQITDANRKQLEGVHGAHLLSESTTKELMSRMNEGLAVVFAVDTDGNVHTLVPEAMQGERSLCNFSFPLATGDLMNLRGVSVFKTSNPKTCWITTTGEYKCVEW
jgi:hypothetical protein